MAIVKEKKELIKKFGKFFERIKWQYVTIIYTKSIKCQNNTNHIFNYCQAQFI